MPLLRDIKLQRGQNDVTKIVRNGVSAYAKRQDLFSLIVNDSDIAYSVTRRMTSDYPGSAIRVRRTPDSAEQDIGFDANGGLDQTALTTFVGSGDGFVRTLYDQSGGNRDIIQTSFSSQPRIVNSGVIIRGVNGLPGAEFIAAQTNFLEHNETQIFSGYPLSLFTVSEATTDHTGVVWSITRSEVDNQSIGCRYSTVTPRSYGMDGRNITFSEVRLPYVADTTIQATARYLSATNRILNTGGAEIIDTVSVPFFSGNNQLSIGRFGDNTPSDFLNGIFQEFIMFEADKSADRLEIELNQKAFYGAV